MALIVNNTTITNLNLVQRATGTTTNIDVFKESGGKVVFTKHFTLTKSSGAVVTRVGSSIPNNPVYNGALENGATINYGDILEITPQTIINNVALFGYFVINGTTYGSSTSRSVRITVTSDINVVAYYWSELFVANNLTEFNVGKAGTSYTTINFNEKFAEIRGVALESLFNSTYRKLRLGLKDGQSKTDGSEATLYTFDKPTLTSSQEITVLGYLASKTQYVTVTGKQYGNLIVPEITFRVRGSSALSPDNVAVMNAQQLIY